MKFTSSSFLAFAIFPASPPFDGVDSADGPGHTGAVVEPRRRERAPAFPPAFLAFLGAVFLLAGGDPGASPDRVSVSLGLILAALVWIALLLVVELRAAAPARPEAR